MALLIKLMIKNEYTNIFVYNIQTILDYLILISY